MEPGPARAPHEHRVGAVLARAERRRVDEAAPVAPPLLPVPRRAVRREHPGRPVDDELAAADVHVEEAVVDAGPRRAVEVRDELVVVLVVRLLAHHEAPAVHAEDRPGGDEAAGEHAHLLGGGAAAAREVVARQREHVRELAGDDDGALGAKAAPGGEEVLPRRLRRWRGPGVGGAGRRWSA